MTDKSTPPKKRGAKGGVKHQPGRGHDRKSQAQKKKNFKRKAARRRQLLEQAARQAWAKWDALPDDVKRILGKRAQPTMPRPRDED